MSIFVTALCFASFATSLGVMWYVVNRLDAIAQNVNATKDEMDRRTDNVQRQIYDMTYSVSSHERRLTTMAELVEICELKDKNRSCLDLIKGCKSTLAANNKRLKDIVWSLK